MYSGWGLRVSGLIWFLFSENRGGVQCRSWLSTQMIWLWELCEDPNLTLLICSLFTKHGYVSGFSFRLVGPSAVCMLVSGFLPQSEHTNSVCGEKRLQSESSLRAIVQCLHRKKANNVASSGLDGQRRFIEFFIVTASRGKRPHLCRGTKHPPMMVEGQTFGSLCSLMRCRKTTRKSR